jgi:ribose 5-phosphate isomerase A
MLTQDEKKRLSAKEALKFLPKDGYIGIGTGSTVNYFIEELAPYASRFKGVITTSKESARRLKDSGFTVIALEEVSYLPIYFDGADEVNSMLQMLKGAGGALLAEKIVASISDQFVCMVDDSKVVTRLGSKVPVAVEVLPYARSLVSRQLVAMGGQPKLRVGLITESGHEIVDVSGLELFKPLELERSINQISGVVENGIFASHPATVLIVAHDDKVQVKRLGGTIN